MTSKSLTLLWTPWTATVALLALLVTAGFSYAAWRRSGYRRSTAYLELTRLAIVALGGLLLNQPEWIESYQPTEKPSIAVLWDDSASMDTCDVLDPNQPSLEPRSRREAIESLTQSATWAPLSERFQVVVDSFATPETGSGTDLHSPLASIPEEVENLVGVVLVSDGDWNDGQPPVEAAVALRLRNVPVMAVPTGSPDRLPDVELVSLDAPTFAIAGKQVRIPFTIDSSLPRESFTTVTLESSNGETVSKDVRIAPQGRTNSSLLWKPAEMGDFTVTLDVPVHSDETIRTNNQLTVPISIREEKLRVLVVESYPRWEYRYLRNALSRDPGVEVSCMLFHPGLKNLGGGSKDYIKSFPDSIEELTEYDVVFLGDVGLGDDQLTLEQCRLLKGLVEFQASGLVFLPGWQGRQLSLLETPLADLYPVLLDETQPGGWGSRSPNRFELTELGRRSLLTKLADTEDENIDVWDGLPGFQWYAPVLRARAGTDVLSVHSDVANDFGRLPLLVTQTFGAGKVLFMGTDGAWRWRKGVEDKYHYRFWGQVVRWMAYQRNMSKGETMRLYYSPDQPLVRKSVTLKANVMEKSGEPLSKGDVVARIVAPSGKTESVRFASTGEEWGAFTGRFTTKEPGKHQITLSCRQTGATLESSFFVQGAAVEPVGRPARPEVLEEIARVTQGKVTGVEDLDEVVAYFSQLPDPEPAIRRLQLWCHPLAMATMVFLLGCFWVARKAAGLI